jgi:hypothetical protein
VWAQDLAGFSVLQGVTDETNVQFNVVHKHDDHLKFFVRDARTGTVYAPTEVQGIDRPYSEWIVTRITFRGLPLLMKGDLLLEGPGRQVKESRRFKLLDTSARNARIALVSCAAGYLYSRDIWRQLNAASVDLVLFLGDNVYSDRPNMVTKRPADAKQQWEQYIAARRTFDFFFRPDLVPALATWDDHDFGKDDGDKYFEHAEAGRQAFEDFWAQGAGVSRMHSAGPGVASAFTAFGIQFVLLDNRLFRTRTDELLATNWGEAQKSWLENLIRGGGRGPVMLANGAQFFGGYRGKDAVEMDFPADMDWLKWQLRLSGRAVGLLSGDVHFSEVMELEPEQFGQASVEITSSSIHSITFPGQHNRFTNPRRKAATSAHNFILLDVTATGQELAGQATSVSSDGGFLFQKNFRVGGQRLKAFDEL